MSTAALPRPAERVAIVSLVLVFLCGCAVGAVVMSYWGHTLLHGPMSGGAGLNFSIKEFQQRLNLSEDQTNKLTSILDDFSLYYDHLSADGNSRVMQILNPEQRQKYEQMIIEHRKTPPKP